MGNLASFACVACHRLGLLGKLTFNLFTNKRLITMNNAFFKPLLSITLLSFALLGQMPAQDKTSSLKLDKNSAPEALISHHENSFLLITEESKLVPGLTRRNVVSKSVYKFDADLNPLWKEPIVFKRPGLNLSSMGTVLLSTVSWSDPKGKETLDYFIASGECYQVKSNGIASPIVISMDKKEAKHKIAAIFTDARGFNILTAAGDEAFPSGQLNWYTWSHDQLRASKRSITLPLPKDIDKENESGWRLNEVSDSGLFFYYVSYKNEVKDASRPILKCHLAKVDLEGKLLNQLDLDMKAEAYTIMPMGYGQDNYSNLLVAHPPLFNTGFNSGRGYSIPTDNAYMGIKIDERTQRIYTVIAKNSSLKVSADGTQKIGIMANEVESVHLTTFNLEGQLLFEAPPFKVKGDENYSLMNNGIDLLLLPSGEGAVCKIMNGNKGNLWALSTKGEMLQHIKAAPYVYKQTTVERKNYVFASSFYSLNDFAASPYAQNDKSIVFRYFQQKDEKAKKEAMYISLKNKHILTFWDSKENTLHFNVFDKIK